VRPIFLTCAVILTGGTCEPVLLPANHREGTVAEESNHGESTDPTIRSSDDTVHRRSARALHYSIIRFLPMRRFRTHFNPIGLRADLRLRASQASIRFCNGVVIPLQDSCSQAAPVSNRTTRTAKSGLRGFEPCRLRGISPKCNRMNHSRFWTKTRRSDQQRRNCNFSADQWRIFGGTDSERAARFGVCCSRNMRNSGNWSSRTR
jgi:hypothetical protein